MMDFDELEEVENVTADAQDESAPEPPGQFQGKHLSSFPHNKQFPDPFTDIPEKLRKSLSLKVKKARAVQIRLIVFYGAGDSLLFWAQWMQSLPDWVEAAVYEWPSHGLREEEPHLKFADLFIADAVEGLQDVFTQHAKGGIFEGAPFAIMGHSTGVVLMCGVAERARKLYGLEPQALFILDRGAPQHGLCSDYGRELQQKDIGAWLRIFHPIMGNVMDKQGDKNEKARKNFQMWCDDIQMQEWTRDVGWHTFQCQLHVFVAMGNWAWDDPANRARMDKAEREMKKKYASILGSPPDSCALFARSAYDDWKEWTSRRCEIHEVQCDHTAMKTNPMVLETILRTLEACRA